MQGRHQSTLNHASDAFKEVDITNLFALIKSYWRVILVAGIIGFVIAVLATFVHRPQYQADALIQVKADNSPTSGLLGKMGALAANISQQATPAQIQQSLLHSRYILGEVVNELHLNVTIAPHYFPFFGAHIAGLYKGQSLAPAKRFLSHYAWGGDKVDIGTIVLPNNLIGKKLDLVKVANNRYHLLGNNGQILLNGTFGQKALNAKEGILLQVNSMQARVGEPFTVVVSDPLTVVNNISARLTISDIGSSSGSDNTGVLRVSLIWPNKLQLPIILNKIIEIGSQKNIIQNSKNAAQSLKFINEQIPRIKSQLAVAEKKLNRYQEAHHIIDMSDQAKMYLTQLGTQEQSLQSMKMQKALLLQSYTAHHPIVRAMNDKIRSLLHDIQKTKATIQNLPSADQQAMSLMRDVKIKEGIYTSLLQRTEELAVVKAGTIGDISVLSLSTKPNLPIPEHAASKVVMGFIIGCVLAVLALLGRKMLISVMLSAGEVEKRIPVTVQAVLPYCKRLITRHQKQRSNSLLARFHKDEPIVEAVRGLRTTMQLALATEQKKIIAILGATPGIGKTLLSTNLALVFSDMNKKVLLIDTDMRRGQTKKEFDLKNDLGLSDYLLGNLALEQVINPIDEHLDVLTSGMYTTKSSDLLDGSKFADMLDELVSHYDYIIIDTPPILALSDSILVAKYATANVFLVGLGKNKPDEITAAYSRYKVNGIVINHAVCNYCSRVAIKDAAGTYEYYNYEYK